MNVSLNLNVKVSLDVLGGGEFGAYGSVHTPPPKVLYHMCWTMSVLAQQVHLCTTIAKMARTRELIDSAIPSRASQKMVSKESASCHPSRSRCDEHVLAAHFLFQNQGLS